MEGMKQFPDGYFDIAIVDPPFGVYGDKARKIAIGTCGGKLEADKQKLKQWDVPPPPEYFQELFRVSKNQLIFGGNYFKLPPTQCFVVWDKGPAFWDRTFADCELIWTSFQRSARIARINQPQLNDKIHPTQKPIALYIWLINRFCKDGDIILDTHVGSGSSLIASYRTGHQYVGFEIDSEYCEAAQRRLHDAMQQLRICDMPAPNDATDSALQQVLLWG
jgi:site-specific DNA-methyltransferase (adenine-specific)